jgi:3-phenylpropionate/trans-cinnamate dioxygenase ferredoxin reductase subunit
MTAAGALVVGASAAGMAAADALREGGWNDPITVLSEELRPPYDRTMLSKGILAGSASQPASLRSEVHLAERQVDLQLGHAARGLDLDRRLVVTSEGATLPYDVLVLATGGRPRTMTTAGGEQLPTLRTAEDLERLRGLAEGAGSATLVGTGFVGLEVAASLRSRGLGVTVLGLEPLPLVGSLGPEIAGWLWEMHRSHGVSGQLGVDVTAVSGGPGGYQVTVSDGRTYRSDLVLTGIGVEPADDWLVGSGVHLQGGVLCDVAGRTDVPDVWVAGDLARMGGTPSGATVQFAHWTNAVEMGRLVGLNIARSETTPYHGLRSYWTQQYGHTLRALGTRRHDDVDEVLEGSVSSGEFLVAHAGPDGVLHGVTSCRRERSLRGYRALLLHGASVEHARHVANLQRA